MSQWLTESTGDILRETTLRLTDQYLDRNFGQVNYNYSSTNEPVAESIPQTFINKMMINRELDK